jgi:hypothetical protein
MRAQGRAFLLFLLALAVVVGFCAIPGRAFAQGASPDDPKQKGDEAMGLLRYQDALDHYKRAYEISKNPAILYNMGRAYEGLGDFPKALDALEEFNDKAPADLKAKVPKLDELLRDLRNRVATLVVSAPVEGAEIRLGEKVIGRTRPGQVVLRVNAGAQKLIVSAEGYFPFEKQVRLEGGHVETVDATLATRSSSAILRISSPVVGAAASVNGKPVGTVPAETTVSPGEHRVALRRDGYDPVETSVIVGAGEKKDVSLQMSARESLTGKWWFWTTIGVIVVAGGVTAFIAATTERDAETGTIPPGQVKAQSLFTF